MPPAQVGEFYEAMGTDAVILVQWAGLNPMGSTHMPPRAGCPHMNIRRTLQSLVEEANLSVVCMHAYRMSFFWCGILVWQSDSFVLIYPAICRGSDRTGHLQFEGISMG